MANKQMGPLPKGNSKAILAAKLKEAAKKKAAEQKASNMMVGTMATKNKPNFNTKGVVVKAKRPSHLK